MKHRNKTEATHRAAWIMGLILLLCCAAGNAQVSPFGGIGSYQALDNSGNLATNAVIYFYQSGTTTQQATYTDSTGLVQNVNPLPFGAGARANVWLTTSAFYKIVLCAANDGPSCSPSDVLYSVDNVPGGASGGGGGGSSCSAGCTGFFISGTAAPATSGVLRMASGDSFGWRNAAGSANLLFSKNSNDLLTWAGGSLLLPEVGAPAGVAANDLIWADNSAHRLKAINNAGSAAQYVLSGNDIGTTDQVSCIHFSSTQQCFSNTAPTTGQFLRFDGSTISGATQSEGTVASCATVLGSQVGEFGCMTFLVNAHTLTRLLISYVAPGNQAAGCTTSMAVSLRNSTDATNLAAVTGANGVNFVDSGVLSAVMPAGKRWDFIISTAEAGCGTVPNFQIVATYQ